jgi:hypothetical protein
MREFGLLGPSDPGDGADDSNMKPVILDFAESEVEVDREPIIVPDYEEALEREALERGALALNATDTTTDGPPSAPRQ